MARPIEKNEGLSPGTTHHEQDEFGHVGTWQWLLPRRKKPQHARITRYPHLKVVSGDPESDRADEIRPLWREAREPDPPSEEQLLHLRRLRERDDLAIEMRAIRIQIEREREELLDVYTRMGWLKGTEEIDSERSQGEVPLQKAEPLGIPFEDIIRSQMRLQSSEKIPSRKHNEPIPVEIPLSAEFTPLPRKELKEWMDELSQRHRLKLTEVEVVRLLSHNLHYFDEYKKRGKKDKRDQSNGLFLGAGTFLAGGIETATAWATSNIPLEFFHTVQYQLAEYGIVLATATVFSLCVDLYLKGRYSADCQSVVSEIEKIIIRDEKEQGFALHRIPKRARRLSVGQKIRDGMALRYQAQNQEPQNPQTK